METKRASSPLFKRSKTPPKIRLTDDDLAIIQCVYRHRLIDAKSIYSLFPTRSKQNLSRRLCSLFDAWFLDRPPQQAATRRNRPGGGSDHLIYALEREGAKIINDTFGVNVLIKGWGGRNHKFEWRNIQHTLATTRFLVGLECSLRQYPHLKLIYFDELLKMAPEHTQRRPQPARFRVPLTWNQKSREEGTEPDAIFGLFNAQAPRGKQQTFFFLEIDRATETVIPGPTARKSEAFFRQSSILKKFLIYGYARKGHIYKKWFGLPATPRILTVTTGSTSHVQEMQKAYAEFIKPHPIGAPPGLFLFTDTRMTTRHNEDLLGMPWLDGLGKKVFIDGRAGS